MEFIFTLLKQYWQVVIAIIVITFLIKKVYLKEIIIGPFVFGKKRRENSRPDISVESNLLIGVNIFTVVGRKLRIFRNWILGKNEITIKAEKNTNKEDSR